MLPPRNREGGDGNPPAEDACASALPDRNHPQRVFTILQHLIDLDWMREPYRRTRNDRASGRHNAAGSRGQGSRRRGCAGRRCNCRHQRG